MQCQPMPGLHGSVTLMNTMVNSVNNFMLHVVHGKYMLTDARQIPYQVLL